MEEILNMPPRDRVLVATQFVGATQNSTGRIWNKIIKKIASEFGEVSVVYPSSHGENLFAGDVNVNEACFKVRLFDKGDRAKRLLGEVLQTFGFAWEIAKLSKKDSIVFTGTNPALLVFLVPFLKKLFQFKWVVLVHDVFPENLVPANLSKGHGFAYTCLQKLSSWAYGSADALIVIGRDMQELIDNKVNKKVPSSFISNWASDKEVYPVDRAQALEEFGVEAQGKVVFQFFGNLGRVQGIDNILKAILLVRSNNAVFVFLGDGVMEDKVRKFVADHPEINIYYPGSVSMENNNTALSACDVAFVTLAEGMKGLGVPSKAYFTMAADRPILAVMDEDAEIARVVKEEKIGWHCEPSEPVALARMIDSICAENGDMGIQSPREYFLRNHTEEIVLQRFIDCIRSVENLEKG